MPDLRPFGSARRLVASALLACAAASGAAAQTGPAAELELQGGVSFSPRYFGSEEYDLAPAGGLRFRYLRLPGGVSFGNPGQVTEPGGFGLRGSFRYIGTRRPSDDDSLEGTDPVDRSLELGLGLGYEAEDWRAFGAVRYGVLGHESLVGEVGADALFRPRDDLTINFGPRAHWGSGDFMDTYFGVSQEEAAESELEAYDPSSGLYSVGMELGATYAFSNRWGLEGAASYERLVDDAGDSPITEAGSRDQFGFRLGLTRTIRLGF
jgi:MipA family protein